eukprot:TRINITY_DN18597_c0_g1_i1.p1 TRINITY_DN18597_c0_g1~~TRINITY_DN18597_c0_g1_i1.p1  ORF type:complete len:108 (+),score=21.03 TRINITY_DN18597_c0_g1_i1:46-369(+)
MGGNVKRRKEETQYWTSEMERNGLVLIGEQLPYCGSKEVVRVSKRIPGVDGTHCCLSCGLLFSAGATGDHNHTCAEHAVFAHIPAGWEQCIQHLIPSTFVTKTNIVR